MVSFTASRMWPSSHLRALFCHLLGALQHDLVVRGYDHVDALEGIFHHLGQCEVELISPARLYGAVEPVAVVGFALFAWGDVAPPVKEGSGKPRLGLVAGP